MPDRNSHLTESKVPSRLQSDSSERICQSETFWRTGIDLFLKPPVSQQSTISALLLPSLLPAMPTKVIRTLFQLSLDKRFWPSISTTSDYEKSSLIALMEKLPFIRKDANFIHQLDISARLTVCSLFTSKVGDKNAITCALYSLLHIKSFLGGIHDL